MNHRLATYTIKMDMANTYSYSSELLLSCFTSTLGGTRDDAGFIITAEAAAVGNLTPFQDALLVSCISSFDDSCA